MTFIIFIGPGLNSNWEISGHEITEDNLNTFFPALITPDLTAICVAVYNPNLVNKLLDQVQFLSLCWKIFGLPS